MASNNTYQARITMDRGTLDALYGELPTLVLGVLGSIAACILCFASTGDRGFFLLISIFALVGAIRVFDWRLYQAQRQEMTLSQILHWRKRAIANGIAAATALGALCAYAIVVTRDPFSELAAISAALTNMVGLVGRNFASRRMVFWQAVCIGGPMVCSLLIFGTRLEQVLGGLFFVFMAAVISMSKHLRGFLQSALKREAEKYELSKRLGIALETMPNGLMMFERAGELSIINAEARRVLDLPADNDSEPLTPEGFIHHLREKKSPPPNSLVTLRNQLAQAQTDLRQHEVQLTCRDGQSLRFVIRSDKEDNLVIRIDNITSQVEAKNQIENMARYDTLTGLCNRGWFFELASEALSDKVKSYTTDHAIAVLDIDAFKAINDNYGHPVGDAIIREVARRLSLLTETGGICARFGGDEFVVLFPLPKRKNNALLELAELVANLVNGKYSVGDIELDLTSSVGVACNSGNDSSIEDLISRADYAQYEAKRESKGLAKVFEVGMEATMLRRRALKSGLRDAIDNNELRCVFQPIVDVEKGRPIAFEALARWSHPVFGWVSPAEFIPLAEEAGIISDITRYQILLAAKACCKWPDDVCVSVNLSALDFRSTKILDSIRMAIEETGIEPHRLVVEVTETSLLDLEKRTLALMDAIRDMGVAIALDDFGVGYSSLNYLHKLNLDRVKLDRSLIENIEADTKTQTLLANIVKLAHDLDIEVIIEGVETKGQLEMIRENVDANKFQGFLFGQGMSEEDIAIYFSHFGDKSNDEPVTGLQQALSA